MLPSCAQTRRLFLDPLTPNLTPILNSLSPTQKTESLTLGPSDTLKLTFQVTETEQDNGVQPHQTFLRFYDSVSGEEGIQPVRVTPGGKAKFELVRLFFLRSNARIPANAFLFPCRTWPAHRRLSLPPPTVHLQSPSFSARSYTIRRRSISLISTSPRPRHPRPTPTKRPSTRSRPSPTPSVPSKSFPSKSSLHSSPRSCSRHGSHY